MIFLVTIDVSLPAEMAEQEKQDLRRRETLRAHELMESNKLRSIWRIVGQTANVGIWAAATLEELHDLLSSMPLYPYVKVDVTPLIDHPAAQSWKGTQN
jgi:muconolactone D-isomerase